MNNSNKAKEVRDFLEVNNVSVIGLMETKIKEPNAKKIHKNLGNKWNQSSNYNHHEKGRVWVSWRYDKCKLETCETHQQYIATKNTPINMQDSFHIVFIYGLHSVRDRKELWQELLRLDYNTHCLFIGDFNAIYKEEHRKNGSQVSRYEIYDILKWMDDKELHPVTERGHKFSWTNKEKGDKRTFTKIDHAIGNLH